MKRLFHSQVELSYEDALGERFIASRIADRGEFWWDAKHTDQSSLWESKIELGEKFFQEIIEHPVPLDLNILKSLKRSPLGLDMYLWLTYRMFNLTRPMRLTWPLLYRQFGIDPAKATDKFTVRDFRADCLREFKKSRTCGRTCTITRSQGRSCFHPRRRASRCRNCAAWNKPSAPVCQAALVY